MKKKKHNINKYILIVFILLIFCLIFLIACLTINKEPTITYEYYINNIESDIPSGTMNSYECDSDVTLEYQNNKIIYSMINKNTKCKVYFTASAGEYIYDLGHSNKKGMEVDILDNVRFVGENPNNYIYYNCTDYNNPSKDTCNLYRIIGSISSYIDGNQYYNLKIMSSNKLNIEGLDAFNWNNIIDENNYTFGYTSLYNLLNNGIYNSLDSYSYTDSSNNTYKFNLKNIGLKNDMTRNMIESSLWHIPDEDDIFTPLMAFYPSEMDGISYNYNIGLINISDYALSKENTCYNVSLIRYFSTCSGSSWINISDNGIWTINSSVNKHGYAYTVFNDSETDLGSPTNYGDVYPTIYLKNDVKIIDGDGSINNPYQIIE